MTDEMGHLVSDESFEELHDFAQRIGLRRRWFQDKGNVPHYDLTTDRMKRLARSQGAVRVSPRDIVLRGKRNDD